MDTMQRYKVRASVEDAIAILDSAPIRRDLIPETNLVQLTNRIPIAHLAIERGLKALIGEAGNRAEHIHGLNRLYRELKGRDQESTDFLALAFDDAVSFFGYNANVKGLKQFRSVEDYLSKVGTENAFELLRYWAIGETGKGESPIPYISPLIHREMLCALWCLFVPGRRETVSARVERKVLDAMFNRRRISNSTSDTSKERSVQWYLDWLLKGHPTSRKALEVAVRHNFAVNEGDEFISQILRNAYTDLQQSKDPAVLYFIRTLTYLPQGSQTRIPGAVAEVEWLGQDQTRGMVKTPAGSYLGFIEKYADGAWGIEPHEDGLVQVSDVARTLTDAKAYLVNRLTRQVIATINGESRQLRIVTENDAFSIVATYTEVESVADLLSGTLTYDLEFWDVEHGISPGDEVSVELPDDEDHKLASVIEGTVIEVAEHKVSVAGRGRLTLRDDVER